MLAWRLFFLGALMCSAVSAAEQTVRSFPELRTALATAAVETIRLDGEIVFDGPLVPARAVCLVGSPSGGSVFRRAPSYVCGTLFVVTSAAARVTLCDLTVDGGKSAGSCTGRLVRVTAGRLTFGRGCAVRDFRTAMPGSMTVGGGELVLADGASVVGFENETYGVAVMTTGSGMFTMLGGNVSGCVGRWRGKPSLARDYDGAVFVNGGTFRALGGRISDNVSSNGVAGVNVHSGKIELGGDFVCVDNAGGAANNIACSRKGELVVRADFSGKATVRLSDDPSEETLVNEIKTAARYGLCSGSVNLSSETSPNLVADLASSVTQMWHATWRERKTACASAAHTLPHLLAALREKPAKGEESSSKPREKVLFDTDIGTDVDDAFALAYLLAEPRCELLGITTCFGAPELRAELASAICTAFGRDDVPIHPGRERPLVYPREPTPPAQVKALRDEPRRTFKADGSAAQFLSRTIRANPGEITLVSVGPFMNVADLLLLDPEAAKLLKRLVVMGGKFFSGVPSPEWNCMCDPEATCMALGSAAYATVPATYLHGLDVTEKTTRTPAELVTLCRQIGALGCIDGVVTDFFRRHAYYAHCGKAMHDPLACVSVFYPELCGYERGCVHVRTDARGVTTGFSKSEKGNQYAAKSVDADAFYRILLTTLDRSSRQGRIGRTHRAGTQPRVQ